MEISRTTRVMHILADDDLRDILEWYGLPVNDRSVVRQTLEDYCAANDVDVEDLLVELTVADVDNGSGEFDEEEDEYAMWV